MLTALIAKITWPMVTAVAWQTFEWWIGRNKKLKSNSTPELIYNIGKTLLKKKKR